MASCNASSFRVLMKKKKKKDACSFSPFDFFYQKKPGLNRVKIVKWYLDTSFDIELNRIVSLLPS